MSDDWDDCGDGIDRALSDPCLSHYQLPVLSVYLGAPMTGLTKTRQKYVDGLRRVITRAFRGYPSNAYAVYDPSTVTAPGSNHSAEEVCTIDHLCVVKADLFVCLATEGSFGLGIEATTATQALVPRLLVHPDDVTVSRMLLATTCIDIDCIAFRDARDLGRQLQNKMRVIDAAVLERRPKRRDLLNDITAEGRGRQVMRSRLRKGLTRRKLHQMTLVPEHLIRAIETHEPITVVIASTQWSQLASALNCQVKQGSAKVMSLVDDNPPLPHCAERSLENFMDFVTCTPGADDQKVIAIWASYQEMQSQALAGREPLDDEISVARWRKIYESHGLTPTLLI